MRSPVRLTGALRGRTAAVTVAGAAVALIGTGTASAATLASAAHAHPAGGVHAATLTSARRARRTTPPTRSTVSTKPPSAPAAPQAAPSWGQIQQLVASQTSPTEPQAANSLQPVGTYGPQQFMPISGDQLANATTIVQQALGKGMGIRSAVIAVATAMQESQLQNINYGDQDSLGLFQQQPDCGWGTAQQILDPTYAADAFLTALQQHQASDPGWATQPLWENAQAVQASGFPTAYAQWEDQAAQLVQQIVTQIK